MDDSLWQMQVDEGLTWMDLSRSSRSYLPALTEPYWLALISPTRFPMKHLILPLMATWMCAHAHAQTPTSVEAAEYDPNSDRWFVSNGSSILATSDFGESWTVFGSGGATHGMEVLGSTLFVIQNNVIRAYDVVSGEELGSLSPTGAGFLNGMGSEENAEGDLLVVSDFASGRLLKVDVSDPTNMTYSTLVGDTGTTPNGVTVKDGIATVVNWGSNADILQVDVATGVVTTLIEGTGLGNCDGVDWANGGLVVSSWSPQRITWFTPDAEAPDTWNAETLEQGSPLSNPADLSVNTARPCTLWPAAATTPCTLANWRTCRTSAARWPLASRLGFSRCVGERRCSRHLVHHGHGFFRACARKHGGTPCSR